MRVAVRCTGCRGLTTVDEERRRDHVFCFICRTCQGRTSYPAGVTRRMTRIDDGSGRTDWDTRMEGLVPFGVARGYDR